MSASRKATIRRIISATAWLLLPIGLLIHTTPQAGCYPRPWPFSLSFRVGYSGSLRVLLRLASASPGRRYTAGIRQNKDRARSHLAISLFHPGTLSVSNIIPYSGFFVNFHESLHISTGCRRRFAVILAYVIEHYGVYYGVYCDGSRGERTIGGEGPFLFFGGEGGNAPENAPNICSPSGVSTRSP